MSHVLNREPEGPELHHKATTWPNTHVEYTPTSQASAFAKPTYFIYVIAMA